MECSINRTAMARVGSNWARIYRAAFQRRKATSGKARTECFGVGTAREIRCAPLADINHVSAGPSLRLCLRNFNAQQSSRGLM